LYLIRQSVDVLAKPLTLALICGLFAAVLWVLRRRRPAGWLIVLGASFVCLGALGVVGDLLLTPLERQFPPFQGTRAPPAVDYIVVLGSSYVPRDGIPITAALDGEGLTRAVEAVRLFRGLGIRHLVVSGGAVPGAATSAEGYALLAQSLGVSSASLIVLDKSLNTADEARAVAALIGSAPFLLVTSAYHMPRAMKLMQRAGARPVAAPTGQRLSAGPGFQLLQWLPTAQGLAKTERALHEYLGLLAIAVGVS